MILIYILIYLILIDNILVLSSNIALNALQLGAPWPKEGRNEYRSYQSAFDINIQFPPYERWKYSTGSTVFASPIISKDGTVYIGTVSGTFYAIHGTTGTKLYSFNCGPIYSTALISNDDRIYVTSADYYVYQLDVSLNQIWKYKTDKEIYASPIIDLNYNVYFGSYGGIFYCIKSDGQLKWSTNLNSPIQQSAVFKGNYIFVILNSNKLCKLYAIDGSKVSSVDPSLDGYMASTNNPPSSFIWSTPVVDEYDNIYFGSRSANTAVYCQSTTCTHIYKFDGTESLNTVIQSPMDSFYSSGAIDHQNRLIYFVGGSLDKLYCYDVQVSLALWSKSNSLNWELYLLKDKAVKSNTEIFIGTPVITSSGLIIVSNTDGEIYIVRNDGSSGTILWNGYVVGDNSPDILNSVAIGADGTIYVTAAGTLYALGYQYSTPPCSNGLGIGTSLASTYYNTNSIQCSICGPGYYSDSSICEVCILGSYSASSQASSCVVCQVGETTSDVASNSPSDCVSCDAGKYSAVPSSGCSYCDAGFYSGIGETSCSSCNAGYYSPNVGSTECSICSAGSYSHDSASECIICSSGFFSVAGSSSCQICGIGAFSTEGSEVCSICPSGTISKKEGSSKCDKCLPGYFSVSGTTGSDTCIMCKWPSTTLYVEGSTSCGYFKLFLRDYDLIKRIFQAFVYVITSIIFIGGIYLSEEHVDESNLRISCIGIMLYAVLPTLEVLFDTLYFSEHVFVTKYLFWAFAFIMLCSPATIFIRHLVTVRAYPCLYTMYMPEFLRYANIYWLHIKVEFYEFGGQRRRTYIYKVEDETVSFFIWLTYLPQYLGKLFIFHIMILPWIFVSFLAAIFMFFFGLILYQFKIMAIGKVHNLWFHNFTGNKKWNVKDKLHLTVMNESLLYSVVFFSFPQMIVQIINAIYIWPLANLSVMERASIVITIIMILWVSVRTFINRIWKKIKIEDIPLDFSLLGLNFLHLDRSLVLIVDYRSGELPIDAVEFDDVEEECPINDNDEEIICVDLGEAMVEQAQVNEVGGSIGTRSENLFDFLDFWSVFGGNDEENLPTARQIQASNAVKAIGVHAYHSNNARR